MHRRVILSLACAALTLFPAALAAADKTLRVVMHSDLKIVDPVWTTAYITRNHGYMIYDTLFAMDEKGEIRPQMAEKYDVSADGMLYTITLRDGLAWHDGKPVTAEDCAASILRWAQRDALGQKVFSFVEAVSAADAKTVTIRLKEKTGLIIYALGKPSSSVPFMMPKRVAETDAMKQIDDFTGSGPFIFKRDEWKPGDKAVYVKNTNYKPRAEPPSSLAGGKVVHFDRVEWRAIADQQQAANALLAGEIDMVEIPQHDLLPLLKGDKGVKLWNANPFGTQYTFRPNHLHKPLDNPKVRQALWYAFNQKDFLDATIGNPDYYKTCRSFYVCPTALETQAGMDGLLESNFARARELLKEAGYDGTPVVLLHSTDLAVLANLAPVAKSLMEKAGFKVDMQSMDWQTLVARVQKKDLPTAGGWGAFITAWNAGDILDPVMNAFLNASCDKARAGWPCDPQLEALRDRYVRETDPAQQKSIAEAVQRRGIEITPYIPLGQWTSPIATRANITGVLSAPVPVFWNLRAE